MRKALISLRVYNQLTKYSKDNPGQEVCGLLSGVFNDNDSLTITKFYPIDNIADQPLALFIMDPTQQMQVMNKILLTDKESIVGCFHSHPHNLGVPSSIDRSNINMEYSWLIYGGQDDCIRAWWPDVKSKSFYSIDLKQKNE